MQRGMSWFINNLLSDYFSAECHSAECHSTEWHFVLCRYDECSTEWHLVLCHSAEYHSTEWHFVLCHSAECSTECHHVLCHSTECHCTEWHLVLRHSAECRGAKLKPLFVTSSFSFYHSWIYLVSQNLDQGILKGDASLYRWPPVWLVWINLFCK